MRNLKWWLIGLAVVIAVGVWFYGIPAHAADLGAGASDAGLEDRIAELEATTARKGNKKVSLKVTGQINKALFYFDGPGFSDTKVIEGSQSESRFALTGEAVVRPGWSFGYTMEIGQGKTGIFADIPSGIDLGTNNDIYTRQSFVFGTTPFGTVSIGLQSMATDDFTTMTIANTDASSKRLTIQPVGVVGISIFGNPILEIELEPFNGEKADSVKYTTREWEGFKASVAWANDDSWDAAVAFGREMQGFRIMAGVGYAKDKHDDLLGLGFLPVESETIVANAGARHIASGLFVQGSYGSLKVGDEKTDAYHIQAGIEQKWTALGATTVYGEYADWQDIDLAFYGLGINQNVIEAVDVYLLGRRYDVGDEDITTVMGGARIKF
jgi:predicted porin